MRGWGSGLGKDLVKASQQSGLGARTFLDGNGGTRSSLNQSVLTGFLEGEAGKREQLQRESQNHGFPRHTT